MNKMVKNYCLLAVFLAVLSAGCVTQREGSTIEPTLSYNITFEDKITEKLFGRDIEVKAPQYRDYSNSNYQKHLLKTPSGDECINIGSSMSPAIGCGHEMEVIYVEGKLRVLQELSVGDVIGFSNEAVLSDPRVSSMSAPVVTHRIVFEGYDEKGRFFITKGDNNDYTDEGIYGKVREEDVEYLVDTVKWY